MKANNPFLIISYLQYNALDFFKFCFIYFIEKVFILRKHIYEYYENEL